jgi:hypothetical protein
MKADPIWRYGEVALFVRMALHATRFLGPDEQSRAEQVADPGDRDHPTIGQGPRRAVGECANQRRADDAVAIMNRATSADTAPAALGKPASAPEIELATMKPLKDRRADAITSQASVFRVKYHLRKST